MNVKIGNRTYKVEFLTQAKSPKYGRDKDTKVLVQTDCLIKNGSNTVVSRGSATQNYRDELIWHNGRKYSLARALVRTKFKKDIRSIFWNKYKEQYPINGK